jgi:hypothetical protein
MIHAGIDYSLTSPAVCVYNDAHPFCFQNCSFDVLSDKKVTNLCKNVSIFPHCKWEVSDERYHNIANHFYRSDLIVADNILIEDYSLGSKGKVFHIAENTEVLQYNLWRNAKKYKKIPPTSLKKWVTGKGNATKELMYEQFLKEEKIDLSSMIFTSASRRSTKIDSPISDIVDSFYLCKYAFVNQ